MEIREMNLEELTARSAEIASELEGASEERLAELMADANAIKERKADLEAVETRKKLAEEVQAGASIKVIETVEEEVREMEEKRTFGVESPEYRDAFYAMIAGTASAEQRTIVVDTTNPGGGDAIAIPKTLDDKIWDCIHEAHPILADIAVVRSGVAMEVTKHTAIATRTTKKLDSGDNAGEESNTFVKVVLYGYDYEKYVQLTYAEAKMSAGALEDYLAQEISAELGEALAKDVFAQILSDIGTAQGVTAASPADMFADIKSALALATKGGQKTIYAPAAAYYEIVGAIKSGVPFNIGNTLGCQVKMDNAATKVTVIDPNMFVLNMVQDCMIESDRDVKNHKVGVSGYMRAQGTMRNTKAAAYVK